MSPITIIEADVQPVVLELRAQHPYKSRGRGTRGCGYRPAPGSSECRLAKYAHCHLGAPPSLNAVSPGANGWEYTRIKEAWQEALCDALEASGLPRPLRRVFVEGMVTFPRHAARRDQGNHRWMLEKALGDALEHGGWLPERVQLAGEDLDRFAGDDWDHYEFGGLQQRVERGVSMTELQVFPTAYEPGELVWWTGMPVEHRAEFT